MRSFRPDIVHTHTAKAGALGRAAAVLAFPRRRPVIVHTYHGHVLRGYFGPRASRAFTVAERRLARVSDCLVGVSAATVEELIGLRVAGAEKFRVIPVGLDLAPYLELGEEPSGEAAERLGVRTRPVLAFVGRFVSIKRLDVLLQAASRAFAQGGDFSLVLAGDGPLRRQVESEVDRLRLHDRVRLLGFRSDVAEIYRAADAAILTSDNEGTPVALIEAAAAARPAIATAVGGVPEMVGNGGVIVEPNDPQAVADAILRFVRRPDEVRRMGIVAREHVRQCYSAQRMIDDVEALYANLISARGG